MTHQANVQARKGELLRKWRANELRIQKPSPSPAKDQLPSVNFKKKVVEYSKKIREQNKFDNLLQEQKHNESSPIININSRDPSASRLRSRSSRTERGRYKPTLPLKPLQEQQKKQLGEQYLQFNKKRACSSHQVSKRQRESEKSIESGTGDSGVFIQNPNPNPHDGSITGGPQKFNEYFPKTLRAPSRGTIFFSDKTYGQSKKINYMPDVKESVLGGVGDASTSQRLLKRIERNRGEVLKDHGSLEKFVSDVRRDEDRAISKIKIKKICGMDGDQLLDEECDVYMNAIKTKLKLCEGLF